ncbi:MAG: hypothetical protein KF847_12545 [Pirellulales bacterium]|nr:hypothetical protein [Pirellulales bacterium]
MNATRVFSAATLWTVLAGSAAADYTFGSFEAGALTQGWGDWSGDATFTNSTIGATDGSQSIRMVPGAIGFYQGLSVKLQDLPDNVEAFDAFVSNTHIAVDVTFNPADFVYSGSGWNGGRLLIFYNEQGAGYQGNFGVDIGDANGFRVPNSDTGNPTNPGFWDIGNYPTLHTRTMTWDYTEFLPALTSTSTGGWTEFFIGTNLGDFTSVALYFDNFRFLTPPAGPPGDFNDDDRVDGEDFLIWQRGEVSQPPSQADLADWQTGYGAAPTVGATVGAVPEPGAWELAAFAAITLLGVRGRVG